MKNLLLLTLLSAFLVACVESEVEKVEYQSTTMMGRTLVTITKDSVISEFNGRGEPWRKVRTTNAGEWTDLLSILAEVKLEDIPTYEAPTNKRATDAAPFGTLFVHTKDSVYKSKTFDGYDSHEALKPAMDHIKKMADRK